MHRAVWFSPFSPLLLLLLQEFLIGADFKSDDEFYAGPTETLLQTTRFSTIQPSGKVRDERAVKLKPLFVVLSARGFHQWWLRSSLASFGEQGCGCQGGKKPCCTLYTSCADSGRHLAENIRNDIICFCAAVHLRF